MAAIHPQLLPVEILESEVLPRLPAKSICRFRGVCKSWNSLFATPTFARMHLGYHQTDYKLLLLDQSVRTFYTVDCDDSITKGRIPFKQDVSILASLDGLVCVALNINSREYLAFWNPLTGAYKILTYMIHLDTGNGAFAFYKDSCNDYKLVYIASEGAFVYSRILDSWRKIPCLEISHRVSNFTWSMATFLEGKVYFMVSDWRLGFDRCMVCFDVESERFKEIQLPRFPCAGLGSNLVALDGCIHLCVAQRDITATGLRCDMWKMDGHGDEWIKVLTFSSPHWNHERKIHTNKNGNWFAIWNDNDSVKNICLEEFVTDYHCYDLVRHRYKEAIYIETLVSPNP